MGAGKTTVGRLLAEQMGFQFIDADDRIELREAKTIPEIFKDLGESAYRDMETEFLKSMLRSGIVKLVMATGGGMIEREVNHPLLRKLGTVVYLEADFATVMQRVPHDPHRPLLNNPGVVTERFNRRQPQYKKLAQITVSTAGKTPEAISEAVMGQL